MKAAEIIRMQELPQIKIGIIIDSKI